MKNENMPKMALNTMKNSLSRLEMKNIIAGTGKRCIPSGDPCSNVTEDNDCCSGPKNCVESTANGNVGGKCN